MKSISVYLVPFLFLGLITDYCIVTAGPLEGIPFPEIKLYVSKNQYNNLQKNNADKLTLSNLY